MTTQSASTATGVTVVTTAETALVTTPVIPENNPSAQGVRVFGVIEALTGTGTTLVTIRVRAGSGTGGALIGTGLQFTVGAAVNAVIPYARLDPTLVSPGLQYTVTYQATGASANATINYADIVFEPVTQFVG